MREVFVAGFLVDGLQSSLKPFELSHNCLQLILLSLDSGAIIRVPPLVDFYSAIAITLIPPPISDW